MEHGSTLLRDIVVYLAAAVVLVPLFIRFKLGAVLGYLAAGILIGPAVLGLVGNAEQTLQFAEFGIVLLLFMLGLEYSGDDLKTTLRSSANRARPIRVSTTWSRPYGTAVDRTPTAAPSSQVRGSANTEASSTN